VLKFGSTLPTVTYRIQLETKEVAPDGTALIDFTVAKATAESGPGIEPQSVEDFKEAATWIEGFEGSYTIDLRGNAQTDGLIGPPHAPPRGPHVIDQIRLALNRTSLPLPENPVGKGARWKVRQVIEQGGIHIDQTSTFELTVARKSRVTVETTIEQTAPPQVFLPPGGPRREFELILLESQSIGKGTWDLKRLGPASENDRTVTNMQWFGPEPERVVVSTSTETVVTMSSK
jgi:hypothetical protein